MNKKYYIGIYWTSRWTVKSTNPYPTKEEAQRQIDRYYKEESEIVEVILESYDSLKEEEISI